MNSEFQYRNLLIVVIAFMGVCAFVTLSDEHLYPLAILPILIPIIFFGFFRTEVMIMWREKKEVKQ